MNILLRSIVLSVCLVWLAVLPHQAFSQIPPPHIFYSDVESGPNTGGENNAGAYVTIYGERFGATRGASSVTVGGGQVFSYPVWSDTKITFQLGPAAATGGIVLTTASGVSNSIPFTVRAGNIYFVSTGGSDSNSGSFASPWKTIPHAVQNAAAGSIIYALNGVSQATDDGQGWNAALTLRIAWCSASGYPRR